MKRATRRQVLSGLAFLGAGAALAACGATPAAQATVAPAAGATAAPTAASAEATAAQPVASGDVKEVEWWFGWSGVGLEDIAALFMERNAGTKVTTVDQGYGFTGKLMAAIASGTPPGLAYNVFYNELIARDLCVPMDDYIAASGDEGLTNGDIPQAIMDRWKWQGKQYGLPACDVATRYGQSYNPTILEENGLSVPEMPQTWEELLEWHLQITKTDSAGNILMLGATPSLDCTSSAHGIDPWVFPFMWGVDYFDDKENKYQIDREETYEFLAMIKKFFDPVGAEKLVALANDDYATANYGTYQLKKQATYIEYPSGPAVHLQRRPGTEGCRGMGADACQPQGHQDRHHRRSREHHPQGLEEPGHDFRAGRLCHPEGSLRRPARLHRVGRAAALVSGLGRPEQVPRERARRHQVLRPRGHRRGGRDLVREGPHRRHYRRGMDRRSRLRGLRRRDAGAGRGRHADQADRRAA